jgi:chromosome partitioning protein
LAKSGTRVIAVANQKGGVGKSTTAVSLGAALAELGHKVLVVDLDPQGNASTGLGIRHEARQVTVYDVLAAEAPIDGAIVETPIANLFAIPSTIDLAGAEIELVSQFSRELRLRKALEPLKDSDFGFVFLDCPPSLGLLTVNALGAAEELIVPIQCEYYALEGLGQLLRNVRLVQQNVNSRLRLTGIVMTMYDPRTKLSDQVVQEVRRYFGDRVYDTIIPRTVRLSEAPGFGLPITQYDPRSRGALSYRALAAEVTAKLPDEAPLPVIEDLPAVVAPPPEPEPARAPRPLVREADRIEVAPDEAADEASEAGAGQQVRAEQAVEGADVGRPSAVGGAAERTSDVDVEAEVAAREADVEMEEAAAAAARSEPRPEDDVSSASTEGVPTETGAPAAPGRESEAARVTVVEEPQQEPQEEAEPLRQDGERKRRWSLFRRDRGGDR